MSRHNRAVRDGPDAIPYHRRHRSARSTGAEDLRHAAMETVGRRCRCPNGSGATEMAAAT